MNNVRGRPHIDDLTVIYKAKSGVLLDDEQRLHSRLH